MATTYSGPNLDDESNNDDEVLRKLIKTLAMRESEFERERSPAAALSQAASPALPFAGGEVLWVGKGSKLRATKGWVGGRLVCCEFAMSESAATRRSRHGQTAGEEALQGVGRLWLLTV